MYYKSILNPKWETIQQTTTKEQRQINKDKYADRLKAFRDSTRPSYKTNWRTRRATKKFRQDIREIRLMQNAG